jgi:hypothetical protein
LVSLLLGGGGEDEVLDDAAAFPAALDFGFEGCVCCWRGRELGVDWG